MDAQEARRQQALMVIEAAQRAGRSEEEISTIVEQDLVDDESDLDVRKAA